jgi:hypothetical protein
MINFLKEESEGLLANHCNLVLVGASVERPARGRFFLDDVT